MDLKKVKKDARNSLKGHYKNIIKMCVIVFLVSFAVALVGFFLDNLLNMPKTEIEVDGEIVEIGISLFTSLLTVIVDAVISFGFISYFLKLSRNQAVTYKEIFSKTNLCFAYIALSFLVSLFVSLWSLLFIIPGIIASFAYTQVYFIKLDNPEIGNLAAIERSKELMNGHKMEFFLLELSFIGWMILGAFTFGILYIWILPYKQVSECNFYNKLIENNNMNIE